MPRMTEPPSLWLPLTPTLILIGAALAHGPIAQLADYHHFADQRSWLGIPRFADVASNLGFLLVALWGALRLWPARAALANGAAGYGLFLLALALTALGSSWYHLAPDDARLIWDRLPIALASAGLLAGVWGDTHGRRSGPAAVGLALMAVASVAWWVHTGNRENGGVGDLRPYLLLQLLPLLLIPLWQGGGRCAAGERRAFALAIGGYALAKVAELNDHAIAALLGLAGHTLKHLLASLACALIVAALVRRVSSPIAKI